MFGAYLLIVNSSTLLVFSADKTLAKTRLHRVPELALHVLAALGGALAMLPLIFLLRHKSHKPRFFLVTAGLFLLWAFIAWRALAPAQKYL